MTRSSSYCSPPASGAALFGVPLVYDMVVKPSFDDAGAILGALIVAVGVAALLVWAGLRTADSTRIAAHSPQ